MILLLDTNIGTIEKIIIINNIKNEKINIRK